MKDSWVSCLKGLDVTHVGGETIINILVSFSLYTPYLVANSYYIILWELSTSSILIILRFTLNNDTIKISVWEKMVTMIWCHHFSLKSSLQFYQP